VYCLPFQYLAYFPSAVFLEKIQGWELVWGLGIQALWVVAFILASRVLWHFGARRYSGYGG
jgi:ABC-2 type transport system permease protein